jgi:hypothetical protein
MTLICLSGSPSFLPFPLADSEACRQTSSLRAQMYPQMGAACGSQTATELHPETTGKLARARQKAKDRDIISLPTQLVFPMQ